MIVKDLLMLSASIDSIGLYSKAIVDEHGIRKERTFWQEGWNSHHMEIRKRYWLFVDWFNRLLEERQKAVNDLIEEGLMFLSYRDEKVYPWILMNDTFCFGYADGEDVSEDEILLIHRLWREFGFDGLVAFVANKRNEEPLRRYRNESYFMAMKCFK